MHIIYSKIRKFMKKNLLISFILYLISSFLVFLLAYNLTKSIDTAIPYYRWDMDHSTVLDSYYLGSNLMPNHLSHPGVGLNFIIIIYQYILHNLNLISSIGFSDLSSSVNLFFFILSSVTVFFNFSLNFT